MIQKNDGLELLQSYFWFIVKGFFKRFASELEANQGIETYSSMHMHDNDMA